MLELVSFAEQVESCVFSVQVQIHPPGFRRIGQPQFTGKVADQLITQMGGIEGIGQENPFLRLSHAQQVCSCGQLQTVGLFGNDPGIAPAIDRIQIADIGQFAIRQIQAHSAGLLIAFLAVNILHAAAAGIHMHRGQIFRPDQNQFCLHRTLRGVKGK